MADMKISKIIKKKLEHSHLNHFYLGLLFIFNFIN
uniref:Uncharacterized protein n=1 Tax=Anguilla anguilla TaxID=7936 RepID=A0A0E9QJL0_ANGAN